jgi:hypothetical protein
VPPGMTAARQDGRLPQSSRRGVRRQPRLPRCRLP